MQTERTFLFLGSANTEGAISRLKSVGIRYQLKRLESRPENWHVICDMIENSSNIGTIAKFNSTVFQLLVGGQHAAVSDRLFRALSTRKHAVFIYEDLLTGSLTKHLELESKVDDGDYDESYLTYILSQEQYRPPAAEVRESVLQLLMQHEINYVPYRTNAELSILTQNFVEESERNLLFRLYVPLGRLYAAESDRLLEMFRTFLNEVGHRHIRQDGYKTSAGRVYEFFGPQEEAPDLEGDVDEFSRLLVLCLENPTEAQKVLERRGIVRDRAQSLVSSYKRDAGRLQLDLKHERESRLLAIRQAFENDLLNIEMDGGRPHESTDENALSINPLDVLFGFGLHRESPGGRTLSISQQIFAGPVSGPVIQNILGTANLPPEAQDLLAQIAIHGGAQTTELQNALHELEDDDAKTEDRIVARQRLKGFLLAAGKHVGTTALAVFQKYLENRIGV